MKSTSNIDSTHLEAVSVTNVTSSRCKNRIEKVSIVILTVSARESFSKLLDENTEV